MNEYDYLAKAKHKMKKEDYHEVISLCDKALKLNEDLPEAYDFRGNAKYELGEYDDALEDFDELIKRDPNDAEHYYDRSWAYCKIDKYEDAIVDMAKALEIKPKTSLYYYEKARFEYLAERYKESVIDLTKGIEIRPTENKYIERGKSYMELEEFELALSDFNSAIEIESESSRAYYHRGILYKRLERLKDAEYDFKKAIQLSSGYDDAMTELGFIIIELNKNDGMKYFNKAIKVNPCADNFYYRVLARARILKRQDDIENLALGKPIKNEKAEFIIFNDKQAQDDIKDLNEAITLDPEDLTYLRLRVTRYNHLKQYENALKDCETLVKLEPENKEWILSKAYCKFNTDDYLGAIEGIDNYLNINDGVGDDFLYYTRGMANYELGERQTAVNDFTKGLAIKETAELYYYKGLTNYKLKKFVLSYKDFKKSLELNPNIESETNYRIPKLIKMFIKKKDNKNVPIGLAKIKD